MKFNRDSRGILCTGIEKVIVHLVAFAQGVVLARLLNPSDFGLTAMLGIFVGIGMTLADGGLGTAIVVGRVERGERAERLVFWWNLWVSIGLYLLLGLASPWIARWYGLPVLSPLMWAMGLNIVIYSVSVVPVARLTKEEQFGKLAWANAASVLLGAGVAVLMAWRGAGVWAIVGMGLTSAAIRAVLVWGFAHGVHAPTADSADFRQLLSFGSKLVASGIIHTVYVESYNLVIGKLWSPAAVGLFSRGIRWAKIPGEIINESVSRVALPRLAKTAANNAALKLTLINLLLLWPALAILWLWAENIVGLVLGPQWLDCVPYLRVLLIGQFFTVGGNVALQKIRASGHAEVVLKTDAWKKPIGLAALAAGVPFGVLGLCWACVVGEVVECAVDVLYAVRLNPEDRRRVR